MKIKNPKILRKGFTGLIFILMICSSTVVAQRSETVSPHGDLTIDLSCEDCHTSDAWIPAKDTMNFDHSRQVGFALIGKHSSVDCQNCHLDLDFTEPDIIGEGCETCHIDVHQGAFVQSCTDCHNQENFADVDGLFIHSQTLFPLTGAHQQIECESCHTDQSGGHFTSLDTDCYSCHAEEYASAETIDHETGGFPVTCEDCHTTFAWETAFFEHEAASGGFALLGAHGMINCGACHEIPSLEPLFDAASDQDCFACHENDYNDEHGGSGFPTDCQSCHNLNSWDDADFEHAEVSGGFELLGEHDELDCESCHTPNGGVIFNPPPTDDEDCYSCHVEDYNEEHRGSGFPTDCLDCHNVNDWDDAEFDHVTVSGGFALLGSHDDLNCQSCHMDNGDLVFASAPSSDQDCYNCHVEDYNEEHDGSGFSTDCRECHDLNNWEGAEFDHVEVSGGFELLGAHFEIDCQSCHTEDGGLVFNPAPVNDQDCYTCHTDDYNEEHAGTGISTDCQDCHNVDTWEGAEFDHVEVSGGFGLIGAHGELDCQSCHTEDGGLVFSPPPTNDQDCYTCHTDDYNNEHAGSGFPTECLECHNTNNWDAEFDHVEVSNGFELLGAHGQLSCESCHTNDGGLVFNPPPDNDQDCYTCHTNDYNDEHSGSGFSTDCLDCHNVNTWEGAEFDHAEVSGFELLGVHGKLDCESCHTNDGGLVFNPPPDNDQDCYTCHTDDYNDEHGGSGFPTDCRDCHNTTDWEDADFDHVDVSDGFELLGAHGKLDCESCHTNDGGLIFNPPPDNDQDCYTCHTDDYNDEHGGSGFPTDCRDCHNTSDWEDANFDHVDVSDGFELLGAHGKLDCESCHTNDGGLIFNPPPDNDQDCYTCHTDDYNDEHGGTGFPTDCLACHNVNDWEDADFEDHDNLYFPIFSGNHREVWDNDCQTCHFVADDFTQFSCIDCHEHNEPETNDDHDEVSGYIYESNACYSCHPSGREEDDDD